MHILKYDTLDSTNNEAKRLIKSGNILEPTCIWTKEQTQGRGTQGRQWVSVPECSLTFTLIWPQSALRAIDFQWPDDGFTERVGHQLSGILNEMYGLKTYLKPVNDIYANHPTWGDGRKLAGILVEGISQGDELRGVLIGIGLNVKPLPSHLQQAIQADSVHQATPISLAELMLEYGEEEERLETLLQRLMGVDLSSG